MRAKLATERTDIAYIEVRVSKVDDHRRVAGAASLVDLTVEMQYVAGSHAFMKVVDVLRDNINVLATFQVDQGPVGYIWACCPHSPPPLVVKG